MTIPDFTPEENQVARRVSEYFQSPRMTFADKLTTAKLIALHDLELHNFAGETEREKLCRYSILLETIQSKLRCE
ncbi:MAG: hypothetical protein ACM3QZ_04745 [Solirubrobacterales bacterium]